MNTLTAIARTVDQINDKVGRFIAWFALLMVTVQFVVVVLRYVFGIGSIMMQESIIYMHAFVFLIGSGYTLMNDGHVRVDIFYRESSQKKKAAIDLFGSLFFLIPVCALITWFTWPYVAGSWKVMEGSKETSGIQAVFLLKSTILIFTGLMILQGFSIIAKAVLTLTSPEDSSATDAES